MPAAILPPCWPRATSSSRFVILCDCGWSPMGCRRALVLRCRCRRGCGRVESGGLVALLRHEVARGGWASWGGLADVEGVATGLCSTRLHRDVGGRFLIGRVRSLRGSPRAVDPALVATGEGEGAGIGRLPGNCCWCLVNQAFRVGLLVRDATDRPLCGGRRRPRTTRWPANTVVLGVETAPGPVRVSRVGNVETPPGSVSGARLRCWWGRPTVLGAESPLAGQGAQGSERRRRNAAGNRRPQHRGLLPGGRRRTGRTPGLVPGPERGCWRGQVSRWTEAEADASTKGTSWTPRWTDPRTRPRSKPARRMRCRIARRRSKTWTALAACLDRVRGNVHARCTLKGPGAVTHRGYPAPPTVDDRALGSLESGWWRADRRPPGDPLPWSPFRCKQPRWTRLMTPKRRSRGAHRCQTRSSGPPGPTQNSGRDIAQWTSVADRDEQWPTTRSAFPPGHHGKR